MAEKIQLVNQNQFSSNGTTICSLTMTGCTIGNTLILAYTIRGDINSTTLTNGWVTLGGGNNISEPSDSNQTLYFAYKVVTSESESVAVTQATTGRVYMVCSEYSGVASVLMRNDLAQIGETNCTVTGTKSGVNDVMVYAVTSAYYSSGRNQTVTPLDISKVEGDSAAERLACWFDNGSGSLVHTFCTQSGYTEARSAVLECVQLLDMDSLEPESNAKYLIRRSTLVDFANEARRISGYNYSLTIQQMLNIFKNAN